MNTHKILVVDDEPANLRMIERLFRSDFDVITAESGPAAVKLLEKHHAAVIITDQRMPDMSGIEFLKIASEMRPQTVRIVLTGYTDVAALVEAINCGLVYKYITKPWDNLGLRQTVARAIEHYEALKRSHRITEEFDRLSEKLERTVEGVVNSAFQIVKERSLLVAEHSRRTASITADIGSRMISDASTLRKVEWAALLHELPNAGTPFRRGSHDAEGFEANLRLLVDVPDLEDVATIIRYQHESFDGRGLFQGLQGDKIPLGSRILAVANALDEGRSGLVPGVDHSNIDDWLATRSATDLDPQIVELILDTDGAADEHEDVLAGARV